MIHLSLKVKTDTRSLLIWGTSKKYCAKRPNKIAYGPLQNFNLDPKISKATISSNVDDTTKKANDAYTHATKASGKENGEVGGCGGSPTANFFEPYAFSKNRKLKRRMRPIRISPGELKTKCAVKKRQSSKC